MELKGIFVTKIDKQEAINLFDDLIKEFDSRFNISPHNKTTVCKPFCLKLSATIRKCFECDMYGPKQCLARIHRIYTKNDQRKSIEYMKDLIQIVFNLKAIINNIIPFNGLPSCKDLLNITPADAASEINNSISNHIIKGIICGGILTKTAIDANMIANTEYFYTTLKTELESQIKAENRELNETESFILSKCNEELMYCQHAKVLTELRAGKEISSLTKKSRY